MAKSYTRSFLQNSFIFTALCLLFVSQTQAANIESTASGNWSASATWLGGVVPGAADDVVVKAGHTVTLSDSRSCISLTVEATATFVLQSTLTNSGALLNQGTVDWTSGTFAGTGSITNDGTLNLNNDASHNLAANIINNGGKTINWNAGHLDFNGGGQTLTNFGTLNLIGDNPNTRTCKVAIVNKSGGSIVKGGSTSANLDLTQPLTNESGGTMTINSGASLTTLSGGNLTNDGTFSVSGTMNFNGGSHTFNPGNTFGGTGTLAINLSTTVTASAGFAPTFATVNQIQPLNAGAATALTISNGTTWNCGHDFGAFTSITNDGTLNINNDANHNLASNLTNNAGKTINWNAGHLDFNGGGQTLTNFGTFNLIGTNPNDRTCKMAIVNAGTVVKPTASNSILSLIQSFENQPAGSVTIQSGASISLGTGGSLAQNGAFTIAGTLSLNVGGSLTQSQLFSLTGICNVLSGSYNFGANAGFTGAGTFRMEGGTAIFNAGSTLNGGVFISGGTLTDNVGFTLSSITMTGVTFLVGGTYTGSGNVTTTGNLSMSNAAVFASNGTTNIQGTLSLSGNPLYTIFNCNASNAVTQNLTFTNGTIGAPNSTGSLTVNGTAVITNGKLEGKDLILNGISTIDYLYLGAGSKLTVGPNGDLTFDNSGPDKTSLDGDPVANPTPVFNNCGHIQKTGSGRTSLKYACIDSKGDIDIDSGQLELVVPVDPTNQQGFSDGTVEVAPGASLEIRGYDPNKNTVFHCRPPAFVLFGPNSFFHLGGNTNAARAVWSVIGDWIVGSTTQGNGCITATGQVVEPGEIRPGSSPGILNYNKLTCTSTTELFIEMQENNTPGTDYDQVAITGVLALDGKLNISFLNGYIPSLNDEFIIFTCGSQSGIFSQIIHPGNNPSAWQVNYSSQTQIKLKLVQPLSLWYQDADGDNFGNLNVLSTDLNQPTGYVANSTDCDDANPAIHPGAPEICNSLDDDCNGNPESAANNWTGNGDGLNWSNPVNWSDGFVPLSCQDVVIPASASVKVPAGFPAIGKTLVVPASAQLETEATGTLEIGN